MSKDLESLANDVEEIKRQAQFGRQINIAAFRLHVKRMAAAYDAERARRIEVEEQGITINEFVQKRAKAYSHGHETGQRYVWRKIRKLLRNQCLSLIKRESIIEYGLSNKDCEDDQADTE